MDAKELGKFIAALRKEKKLTQMQLAEKIHVTDKAISKWERGMGFPDITNFEALAEALEVSVAELIQCSKNEEDMTSNDVVEQAVIDSFEIARYERQKLIRSFALILFGVVFGFISIVWGLRYYRAERTIIGQAQATTSIQLSGNGINLLPWLCVGLGCVLLLVCCVVFLKRVRRKDKK